MNRLVVLTFLCLWLCDAFAERKLPSYVNVCKRYDPDISKCWDKTVKELKPYLTKGIPEFNISPITEFHVDRIHLDQQNTASINFVADLMNLTFYGGENYEIPYTRADFKSFVLHEGMNFPKLVMKGNYKAKGRILLFEFEGEGDIDGEFEDVQMNGTWYFKVIKKKGKEHMQIERDEIDVQPGKIYLYMHNLFRGNPEITKNVNNAINENSDVLYEDFKPLLQTTLQTLFRGYFNRVYSLYPLDVLLPIE